MRKTKERIAVPATTETKEAPAEFMTVKQASNLLNLSEVSIRRFLTQKRLRRYKAGARTLLKYTEVRALIREA